MISLIINIIMAIGMVATLGWAVITFQKSSDISAMTQRNTSRMETLSSLLKTSLKYSEDTGKYMIPIDDAWTTSSTDRMVLPAFIVGDDHTPWGAKYAFCPYSPNPIGSETTGAINGGTTTEDKYSISIRTLTDDKAVQHNYVSASNWTSAPISSSDITGFIISPAPYRTDLPNCTDIKYSNGYYIISGSGTGSVVAVSSAGMNPNTSLLQNFVPTIYVGPSSTGNGSGSDQANLMAFSGTVSALSFWHQSRPSGMKMIMTAGNYTITSAEADMTTPNTVPADEIAGLRSFLHIQGPSSGTASIAAASGTINWIIGTSSQFTGNIQLESNLNIANQNNSKIYWSAGNINGTIELNKSRSQITSNYINNLLVQDGDNEVVSPEINTLTMNFGSVHLTTSGTTIHTTNLNAGILQIKSNNNNANLNQINFNGGNLSLDGTTATTTSAPTFQADMTYPKIEWKNLSSIIYDNGSTTKTYSTPKEFIEDFTTETETSQCDINNNCTTYCSNPNFPYMIEGSCATNNPQTTISTISELSTSPTNGWLCRWKNDFDYTTMDVVTAVSPAVEVTTQSVTVVQPKTSPSPAGTTKVKCSKLKLN